MKLRVGIAVAGIAALALKLLEGEFAEGGRVRVDAEEGELVFRPAPTAVADVA